MQLTSEQRALRDAVRGVLRRHPPELSAVEAGPAYRRQLWRLLSAVGVAGLAVPEVYGGAAAGPVELNIVAEELGRVLAPSPLIGSAVLATQAILAARDTSSSERLLPKMADG